MGEYVILYRKDRFLQLENKYKYLCGLHKENPKILQCINYRMKTQFEDTCGLYIDSQDGTLIFAHKQNIWIGGGCASNVEYARVISFDAMQALLEYEVEFYRNLVRKWEKEADETRADHCRSTLRMLEKIRNTETDNWREFVNS